MLHMNNKAKFDPFILRIRFILSKKWTLVNIQTQIFYPSGNLDWFTTLWEENRTQKLSKIQEFQQTLFFVPRKSFEMGLKS